MADPKIGLRNSQHMADLRRIGRRLKCTPETVLCGILNILDLTRIAYRVDGASLTGMSLDETSSSGDALVKRLVESFDRRKFEEPGGREQTSVTVPALVVSILDRKAKDQGVSRSKVIENMFALVDVDIAAKLDIEQHPSMKIWLKEGHIKQITVRAPATTMWKLGELADLCNETREYAFCRMFIQIL